MKHGFLFFIFVIISGCSVQNPKSSFVNVDSNLEFSEFWGYCYHVYARSEDNNWLIRVNVGQGRGVHSVGDIATLIDLSAYEDKNNAISLYRGNDIAIESDLEITIPASSGDVFIRHKNSRNIFTSSVDVKLKNIQFLHANKTINLSSAYFHNLPVSNFCGG